MIERLRPPYFGDGAPAIVAIVAIVATGGIESVVSAGLGASGLPIVVVSPVQVRASAQAHDRGIGASGRRPTRSMRLRPAVRKSATGAVS